MEAKILLLLSKTSTTICGTPSNSSTESVATDRHFQGFIWGGGGNRGMFPPQKEMFPPQTISKQAIFFILIIKKILNSYEFLF